MSGGVGGGFFSFSDLLCLTSRKVGKCNHPSGICLDIQSRSRLYLTWKRERGGEESGNFAILSRERKIDQDTSAIL